MPLPDGRLEVPTLCAHYQATEGLSMSVQLDWFLLLALRGHSKGNNQWHWCQQKAWRGSTALPKYVTLWGLCLVLQTPGTELSNTCSDIKAWWVVSKLLLHWASPPSSGTLRPKHSPALVNHDISSHHWDAGEVQSPWICISFHCWVSATVKYQQVIKKNKSGPNIQ